MRTLLTALLIILFAGVHTATAYTMTSVEAGSIGQAASMDPDTSGSLKAAFSHHAKCCETGRKTDTSAKVPGCSADCLAFYVDPAVFRFIAETGRESRSLPVLSALNPDLGDRPPTDR